VVAFAADDVAGADRDLAASLVSDCPDCQTLYDDLQAIARATAVLPAVPRRRDFRLSRGDAARLRPAGWRRVAGGLASPRLAFTRQLGVGLTTLGIAGLLFTVLPGVSFSLGSSAGATAAPSSVDIQAFEPGTEAGGAGASPAASGAAAAPQPSASTLTVRGGAASLGSREATPTPIPAAEDRSVGSGGQSPPQNLYASVPAGADGGSGPPLLLIVSWAAIATGLGLLIARRLARRFAGR